MSAHCSSLDATEIQLVVDSIIAACVRESSDVSLQSWLLNQQMQEVLLYGDSVEAASFNGLIPKELLQRLVDAANVALRRMSDAFSASVTSHNSLQGLAEEEQAPEEGRALAEESQSNDEAPATFETRRRCPAQEKLENEIADYDAEIEQHLKMSGAEHASRVVELDKLRAASEYKLKKLLAGYKAYQRWREANTSKNAPTRGDKRLSLAPLDPGKHHKCGDCGKQFKTGIECT